MSTEMNGPKYFDLISNMLNVRPFVSFRSDQPESQVSAEKVVNVWKLSFGELLGHYYLRVLVHQNEPGVLKLLFEKGVLSLGLTIIVDEGEGRYTDYSEGFRAWLGSYALLRIKAANDFINASTLADKEAKERKERARAVYDKVLNQ